MATNQENRAFMRSLPILASIMGKKLGVKIQIGSLAKTDGETICLPPLPLDGGEELFVLANGFLDHEASHIRETDFKALAEARMDSLTHHFWNQAEDMRVERELSKVYPGCRKHLHKMYEKILEDYPGPNPDSPGLNIMTWFMMAMYSLQYPHIDFPADRFREAVENQFPNLLHQLEVFFPSGLACDSTQECIDWARSVVAFLFQYFKQTLPTSKEGEEKEDGLPSEKTSVDAEGKRNTGLGAGAPGGKDQSLHAPEVPEREVKDPISDKDAALAEDDEKGPGQETSDQKMGRDQVEKGQDESEGDAPEQSATKPDSIQENPGAYGPEVSERPVMDATDSDDFIGNGAPARQDPGESENVDENVEHNSHTGKSDSWELESHVSGQESSFGQRGRQGDSEERIGSANGPTGERQDALSFDGRTATETATSSTGLRASGNVNASSEAENGGQVDYPEDEESGIKPYNPTGSDMLDWLIKGDIQGDELPEDARKSLASTINAEELPKIMGEMLKERLEEASQDADDWLQVAVAKAETLDPIPKPVLSEAMGATVVMSTRLSGLLQARALQRIHTGRRGRIDGSKLYRLASENPRVFRRTAERQFQYTAVHILLDCSGSMTDCMTLANAACYSVASALHRIKGVNVGVTAFPGRGPNSVNPILRHGQSMHTRFAARASGGTPMGEALWWIVQEMYQLKEERKIILILSDGVPDSVNNTKAAIETALEGGYELLGVGIGMYGHHIHNFIENSRTITTIEELAPAMFAILQQALTQRSKVKI